MVEAAEKMKQYYFDKEVDVFKDAVSLPGVSLQYLMRGSERGQLFAPELPTYELLKAAVTGGPSLVFTRYNENGKTKIRSHKYGNEAKVCKTITGYDGNALYPSTFLQNMPCEKEKLTHYEDLSAAEVEEILKIVKSKKLFGFVKCDIRVPKELWPIFEEFPPLFMYQEVPEAAVGPEMVKYLTDTGRTRGKSKKLLRLLETKGILLFTPLLRWYLEHGLVVDAIHDTIEYTPKPIFAWFVEEVTTARRLGDTDNEKVLYPEIMKLLGNSAYGKLIEALERRTTVSYTKDEKVLDKVLRLPWFEELDEYGRPMK